MRNVKNLILLVLVFGLVLSACAPKPTPTPEPTATLEPTPIPPTETPVPTEVPTIEVQGTEEPVEESQPQAGERYHVSDGGFSYIIPEGWTLADFPGLKYKILASDKLVDGVMPNLVFVDSPLVGNLADSLDSLGAGLTQMQPNFKVLSIDQGQTKQGHEYYRLTATNETNGMKMTQVQYYFDLGGTMLVITYSTGLQDTPENEAMIEQFIQDVQFEE